MNARPKPAWASVALLIATTRVAGGAEAHPSRVGDSRDALPGIDRVGIVAAGAPRVAMAGTAGYGYVEPAATSGGADHRLLGTAAASFTPIIPLAVALRLDGRYDRVDGRSNLTGDPRLVLRGGTILGKAFHVGAEAVVWVPGGSAPSLAFDATTLDAALLAAWAPESGPAVALRAGYRLDNSEKAFEEAERLRAADRATLGLNGHDAALLGLGASVPVGPRTEILGEVSGDLLVGAGAPPLMSSPLRVVAGARHQLTDTLALTFLVEGSPSGRPSLASTDPLVSIEPRIGAHVGLRVHFPLGVERRHEAPAPADGVGAEGAGQSAGAPVSVKVSVGIRVTNERGEPVTTAVVELHGPDWSRKQQGCPDGLCRFGDVPAGDARVTVTAEGFESGAQDARFEPGARVELRVALKARQPSGQIRGLVRSFGGRSLSAKVTVEPIGIEVTTDAQGYFTLDVQPGKYSLVITASGFKEQRRSITVEKNGVTVLNAELFESGKKR